MQDPTPLPPPFGPRPWYYRWWFLVPTFIFGWPVWLEFGFVSLWPVWSLLIIRSPWHTGFVTGTLSWAMLISNVAWIGYLAVRPDNPINPLAMTFQIAPGIALTVLTQYLWARHRALSQLSNRSTVESDGSVDGRPRRRRRRRVGRPGRSSRHPR